MNDDNFKIDIERVEDGEGFHLSVRYKALNFTARIGQGELRRFAADAQRALTDAVRGKDKDQ